PTELQPPRRKANAAAAPCTLRPRRGQASLSRAAPLLGETPLGAEPVAWPLPNPVGEARIELLGHVAGALLNRCLRITRQDRVFDGHAKTCRPHALTAHRDQGKLAHQSKAGRCGGGHRRAPEEGNGLSLIAAQINQQPEALAFPRRSEKLADATALADIGDPLAATQPL